MYTTGTELKEKQNKGDKGKNFKHDQYKIY